MIVKIESTTSSQDSTETRVRYAFFNRASREEITSKAFNDAGIYCFTPKGPWRRETAKSPFRVMSTNEARGESIHSGTEECPEILYTIHYNDVTYKVHITTITPDNLKNEVTKVVKEGLSATLDDPERVVGLLNAIIDLTAAP